MNKFRYEPIDVYEGMVLVNVDADSDVIAYPDEIYVKHTDALAAVSAARADALRLVLWKLDQHIYTATERDRLRAIIEEELSK